MSYEQLCNQCMKWAAETGLGFRVALSFEQLCSKCVKHKVGFLGRAALSSFIILHRLKCGFLFQAGIADYVACTSLIHGLAQSYRVFCKDVPASVPSLCV